MGCFFFFASNKKVTMSVSLWCFLLLGLTVQLPCVIRMIIEWELRFIELAFRISFLAKVSLEKMNPCIEDVYIIAFLKKSRKWGILEWSGHIQKKPWYWVGLICRKCQNSLGVLWKRRKETQISSTWKSNVILVSTVSPGNPDIPL